MALYIDGAVIVIIAVTCITGYRKGFIKYLAGMVTTIAAVGISFWVSNTMADTVYRKYFREPVKNEIISAVDSFDAESALIKVLDRYGLGGAVDHDELDSALSSGSSISDGVGKLLDKKGMDNDTVEKVRQGLDSYFTNELPQSVSQELADRGLSKYVSGIGISTEDIQLYVSKIITESNENAASYIEEHAARPLITGIIKTMLFGVTFVAVSLVLKLIVFISGILTEVTELRTADRLAGLALGAAKGLLYCALLGFVLSAFVKATGDNIVLFNSETAHNTYLFKYFFDFFTL